MATTKSKVALKKKAAAPASKKSTSAGTPAKKGNVIKGKFPVKGAKVAAKKGARKTARPARKPIPTWAAPADFKPHFVELTFKTERDGLLGSQFKAVRVTGSYDFEDPMNIDEKKKADLIGYDVPTMVGIQSRLSAVMFRSNADRKYPADVKERNKTEKYKHEASGETRERLVYRVAHRLPANTTFRMVIRVNKKKADDTISVLRKKIYQVVKNEKTGKMKLVMLENKDPIYRALSRAVKVLPAAFKGVLLPPKRTRGRKVEADEE